jgi:osmoprotectant transport system substrate-binding protein
LLAAVLPSGCKPKGVTLKIGSQGYAEVEILAELFKALVEAKTEHKVEHVRSLGSAMAGMEATLQNDIQMFQGFTGTFYIGLFELELTDDLRQNPDKVYDIVHERLLKDKQLYAAPPYGYNNTYTIAVPRAWAEANNVSKQSDLAPFAPQMILAVDQTFLNYPGQGYKEYCEVYGFKFKEAKPMDFGLIYPAIAKGDVDAVNAYSTDGQLVAQDLRVLEDDKHFNPPYYGILVLRNEIVEKYPEIKALADSLKGLISTDQMQALNKQVSVDQKEPGVVAREFLKSKGLIG